MSGGPRHFGDSYVQMYEGRQAKNVTFLVTHRCNLRCTYCYEHHKSDARMSLETAKQCVDLLFAEDERQSPLVNEHDAHGLILDFIGGEPLLEIGLIDDIMAYFLSRAIEKKHRWATNYMISMSTNGLLGDEPAVKRFLQKYAGRVSVGVTIDGDRAAHDACRVDAEGRGSYDRAIRMFRAVTDEAGRRHTKYTVAPGNLPLLAASVRHLIENEGVGTVHCNCVYEAGWTAAHARELYRQLKEISDWVRKNAPKVYVSILDWQAGGHLPDSDTQNWCGGAGRMLAFDVDGTVLPCMRYSPLSVGEKQPLYRIGDVGAGIARRPDDAARLAALQRITRQSQSAQECLECPINEGCAWCTAYNYEVTGSPDRRVTYICEMHKARVLAQVYHHNHRHLENPAHPPKAMRVPRAWAVPIVGEAEYEALCALAARAGAPGEKAEEGTGNGRADSAGN